MNKYIFGLLLSLSIFLAAGTVHAQSGTTRVRGNIYDYNNGGQGIGGLNVTVVCNSISKGAITNSFGLYVVDYTASECPAFTPVSATVTFNSQTQSQTVFVSGGNTATIDFYYGSVSVPEFGMIPGIVAAVGSGLGYLGLRRRMQ